VRNSSFPEIFLLRNMEKDILFEKGKILTRIEKRNNERVIQ